MKFFLLGGAMTLLVLSVIVALPLPGRGVRKRVGARWPSLDTAALRPAVVAPWGQIEATEILLANPEPAFLDQAERMQKPRWFFENFSEDQLTRFLLSCDLNSIQTKVLLDKRFWTIETNGCVITPPAPMLWYLKSASRRKIYAMLARSPANFAQCYPFRFLPGTLDDFLAESGLNDRDVEKISRLTYTSSGVTCFTDLETVQALLTPDEFEKLVQALYQTPALALYLRVTPDSDIEMLSRYWGKGGREKLIEPLLRALGKVPGGATINVSFLLPPFARNRLYTYPVSWNNPATEREDCFFTAMNFFNETSNTNFFDWNYAGKVLDTDFSPVIGRPTYGDLVAVRNSSGAVIHVCVYLAKDFVFTKNGLNRAQPWVLMRMTDMLKIYRAPAVPGQLMFFRRRTAA